MSESLLQCITSKNVIFLWLLMLYLLLLLLLFRGCGVVVVEKTTQVVQNQ